MKRGTDLKLKFLELKAALDLPLWGTKGVLQAVWDFAAENAMHGDLGRFTDEQIAIGIGWPVEKATKLIDALVTTRWLDRCRNHRLVIHDWPEHCESWVRKRVERSGKPFVMPNRRTTGAAREEVSDNGSLPHPVPGAKSQEPDPVFARVMSKYPKRAGGNPPGPAFESWSARLKEGVSADALESAVESYATFCAATGKIGTEFVMQASSFFGPKKRGWEQDWSLPQAPVKPAVGERVYVSPTGKIHEMNGKRVHWLDEADRRRGAFEDQQLPDGRVTIMRGGDWYPSREVAEAAIRSKAARERAEA